MGMKGDRGREKIERKVRQGRTRVRMRIDRYALRVLPRRLSSLLLLTDASV